MKSYIYKFATATFLMVLVALVLNVILFAFQFYANNAPERHILTKIQESFKYNTFIPNEYPGYGPPFYHRALLGRVHYTECQLALVAIVDFDSSLRGAVIPKAYKAKEPKRNSFAHCQDLYQYSKNSTSESFRLVEKRSRYLWGGSAFMGNALRYMSVFQMKEFLKKATVLSIFLLSLALLALSKQVFYLLSPLLVSTILFSGTSFFSDVAFGLPFVISLLGPAILCLSWIKSSRDQVPLYVAFLCGGFSSFVWLIDGHTLQFTVWIFLVSYFALLKRGRENLVSVVLALKTLTYYGMGFVSTYVLNQLIKSYYLGIDKVWRSFISQARLRSSNSTSKEPDINLIELLQRLWHNGFEETGAIGHPLLADAVLYSSFLALVIGIVISLVRYLRNRKDLQLVFINSVILGIFAYFLIRFFFTQNHSWILPHSHFVGRYLFILVGLCWVSLIAPRIFPAKIVSKQQPVT